MGAYSTPDRREEVFHIWRLARVSDDDDDDVDLACNFDLEFQMEIDNSSLRAEHDFGRSVPTWTIPQKLREKES